MAILKFLFVVVAATLILSACGGGNEEAKSSEIDWTALAGEDGVADTDAATGLVVLDQGFSIVLDDASVGVIVKNTSDEPACFIDILMDFYDRNAEPVGDSSLSLNELGRLTFVGKNATSYRFVERITKTTSTGCALARGIDRFTPLADGSLDYTWKLDGGGQSASTTLRRSVT